MVTERLPSSDAPTDRSPDAARMALAHAVQRLEGAPSLSALPTDHPRPHARAFDGARHVVSVPASTVDALRSLADGHGLDRVLLAGLAALVARQTGQTDVVLAHARDGHTVAVRMAVGHEATFGALTDLAQRASDEAGDVAIDRVAEAMGLVGATHPPLAQLALGETGDGTRARFDLALRVIEHDGRLDATVDFDRALYDAEGASRIVARLWTLLEGAARAPRSPVASLPLLPQSERDQVLIAWNRTDVPRSDRRPVHRLVADVAREMPDACAVRYGSSSLTYGELDARATALARVLRGRGVGRDARVGICAARSLEMAVGVLAIFKAGGAYVPFDPTYPRDRLAYMFETARVAVLLTQKPLASLLPVPSDAVVLLDEAYEASDASLEPEAQPEDLAYVLYTSGSTGTPKGVAMPHGPLRNLIDWQLAQSPRTRERCTLQFASLNFDVAFQEIFSTWCAGGTLVLVSETVRRDPPRMLALIEQEGVERLFLPFVALQGLAEVGAATGTFPSKLREVITAGEQLQVTPQVVTFFQGLPGSTLHNQYGPSESHVVTFETLRGDPANWPVLPTIGRPIDNAKMYVLDEQLEPTPIGTPGGLYIGGPVLARGYLGRDDLTAERFVRDPFADRPDATMYRTGDVAKWRADGTLDFLGRADHQVKIRGYRVELGEIEAALAAVPGVREAAVAVREDSPGDKRLVAYVTGIAGGAPDTATLRQSLAARLPEYMVPVAFVVLDAMPLTPSGKVDRRGLPAPVASSGEPANASVDPPRSETEAALIDVWARALGGRRPGLGDDFFALGGNSLLAVRVVTEVAKTFELTLPTAVLFRAPTIEKMARVIDSGGGKGWSPIVTIQGGGTRPPLFWGHTLGGGGGGGFFRYRRLAELLGADQPSLGIEAPSKPFDNLHAMAAHYVEVMRAEQPEGPYYLAGYCFGGNVVYEMARQLVAAGERVALLALIETEAPRTRTKRGIDLDSVRHVVSNVPDWLALAARRPREEHITRITQRAQGWWRGATSWVRGAGRDEAADAAAELAEEIDMSEYPAGYVEFANTHWRAFLRYPPERYSQRLTVLRGRPQRLSNTDPTLGWRDVVDGELCIRVVPSWHADMLDDPHVAAVARELRAALDEAFAREIAR